MGRLRVWQGRFCLFVLVALWWLSFRFVSFRSVRRYVCVGVSFVQWWWGVISLLLLLRCWVHWRSSRNVFDALQ